MLRNRLLGNVFSHTEPGTAYRIEAYPGKGEGQSVLVVADEGDGFEHAAPLQRGASGAGSRPWKLATPKSTSAPVRAT